jgi:hypothetical protein
LIDQTNNTNVIQKKLWDKLIEELLLKAENSMNSKPPKEPQMTDDDDDDDDEDDGHSNRSDDEEPILDIVEDREIKQFELQQKEFSTTIVSLKNKFSSIVELDQENKSEQLQYLYEQLQREMKHWKTPLPMYSRRTDIVELIRNHQVSILKADTGSGKSTQVVQYLCDAGFAQESTCILFRIHHKLFFHFRTNPLYSTAKTRSKYLSVSCGTGIWMRTRTGSKNSS